MIQALINVFKIAELRTKVLFTLGMLAVYRIGFWIPLPGVNQEQLRESYLAATQQGSAFAQVGQYMSIFSGGAFSQSTIFGLGIMPYISAAIIIQLLQSVSKRLQALKNEGPSGQQKIQHYTRLLTVALCIVQAFGLLQYFRSLGIVYPAYMGSPIWWVMAISTMTAGTVFLMWIGEQIDKYGIGNGASLIIMAGILSNMDDAILQVAAQFDPSPTATSSIGWLGLLMLIAGFVVVVAGTVLMTVAQRRIPIQQAKHTRGRKVYGGQKSYLPLRVNHSGVMPIIFASSLMIFPSIVFSAMAAQAGGGTGGEITTWQNITLWLRSNFEFGAFPYLFVYVAMVYFFAYFWITVQFNPEEMSKQLRDHGSFIPGLRPGPRTAEYLETVMERLTFVGAAFLAVIAVVPMLVQQSMNISFMVTQFLGGTGLLIVVSVALDFIQRVEANLLMRNYAGFLGGDAAGKGPRIRGPR